jgi:hypothetical protein
MQFDKSGRLISLEGYALPYILKEGAGQDVKVIRKELTGERFDKEYNRSSDEYPTKFYDITIDVLNNNETRRYKFPCVFEKYFNEWTGSDVYEDEIEEITEI